MQQLDERVKQFIELRDHLAAFDKEVATERAKITTALDILKGQFSAHLKETGQIRAGTTYGTIFFGSRKTAPLSDPQAFMDYVIESHNYELLERRASASAVEAYLKENQCLPPGCGFNDEETVNVRRRSHVGDTEDE